MRVPPSLLFALVGALSACSLERTPLLPDGVDVPSGAGVSLPSGGSTAGSGNGGTPTAGSGGMAASGSGGDASSGGATPSAGGEPTAGVAPPVPGLDAGSHDAGLPDAGPATPPDAGSTPDVTFAEGSCPSGYECLPFLFLGFMCQQGGILMPCNIDNTCPYDASCGSMAGAPGPVCFQPCTP